MNINNIRVVWTVGQVRRTVHTRKCVLKLLEGIQLDQHLCSPGVFLRFSVSVCSDTDASYFFFFFLLNVRLSAVTLLPLLPPLIQRKKVPPGGKAFASPSSPALENWPQNRASSQGKQLCVPNCPTTSLSLHQCLVGAEKSPRAEEKVPAVDYYYFFLVAAPRLEMKGEKMTKTSSTAMLF